eukprot:6201355-Pleurochrysis_carterae.AAC.1
MCDAAEKTCDECEECVCSAACGAYRACVNAGKCSKMYTVVARRWGTARFSDAVYCAPRNTLVRAACAARRRRLDKPANNVVSWRHARPAMSMAMPMQTLMTKAAATKEASTHRTLEMYGVQTAATSASSCDASNTDAGGRTVIMIKVRWSVHEHARNAKGASSVARRSVAATAAGLSAIAVCMSLPMKTICCGN